MEEQREKTMLLGADKTSGKEHGLGLMHPWVDYAVHIPFRVPRIPHSEGATFWDNWLHHTDSTPQVSDPEASKSSPPEPAPTPPLAVRLGALLLLFLLVFGPTLSYSSVGALYTQLKTDMGFTDGQLGFLFSAYALPNIVAVFFAGVMVDSLGVNFCCLLFAGSRATSWPWAKPTPSSSPAASSTASAPNAYQWCRTRCWRDGTRTTRR